MAALSQRGLLLLALPCRAWFVAGVGCLPFTSFPPTPLSSWFSFCPFFSFYLPFLFCFLSSFSSVSLTHPFFFVLSFLPSLPFFLSSFLHLSFIFTSFLFFFLFSFPLILFFPLRFPSWPILLSSFIYFHLRLFFRPPFPSFRTFFFSLSFHIIIQLNPLPFLPGPPFFPFLILFVRPFLFSSFFFPSSHVPFSSIPSSSLLSSLLSSFLPSSFSLFLSLFFCFFLLPCHSFPSLFPSFFISLLP